MNKYKLGDAVIIKDHGGYLRTTIKACLNDNKYRVKDSFWEYGEESMMPVDPGCGMPASHVMNKIKRIGQQ